MSDYEIRVRIESEVRQSLKGTKLAKNEEAIRNITDSVFNTRKRESQKEG